MPTKAGRALPTDYIHGRTLWEVPMGWWRNPEGELVGIAFEPQRIFVWRRAKKEMSHVRDRPGQTLMTEFSRGAKTSNYPTIRREFAQGYFTSHRKVPYRHDLGAAMEKFPPGAPLPYYVVHPHFTSKGAAIRAARAVRNEKPSAEVIKKLVSLRPAEPGEHPMLCIHIPDHMDEPTVINTPSRVSSINSDYDGDTYSPEVPFIYGDFESSTVNEAGVLETKGLGNVFRRHMKIKTAEVTMDGIQEQLLASGFLIRNTDGEVVCNKDYSPPKMTDYITLLEPDRTKEYFDKKRMAEIFAMANQHVVIMGPSKTKEVEDLCKVRDWSVVDIGFTESLAAKDRRHLVVERSKHRNGSPGPYTLLPFGDIPEEILKLVETHKPEGTKDEN